MLLIISRNEDRPELESKILAAAFRQSVERGDVEGSRLAHRELVTLLAKRATAGSLTRDSGDHGVDMVFASDNVRDMDLDGLQRAASLEVTPDPVSFAENNPGVIAADEVSAPTNPQTDTAKHKNFDFGDVKSGGNGSHLKDTVNRLVDLANSRSSRQAGTSPPQNSQQVPGAGTDLGAAGATHDFGPNGDFAGSLSQDSLSAAGDAGVENFAPGSMAENDAKFVPQDHVATVEEIEPSEMVEDFEPGMKAEELAPQVKAEEPEPVVKAEEPEPVVKAEELEPEVKAEEPEPVVEAEELEPVVEAEELEPVARAEDLEPVVWAGELEPVVRAEDLEPVVKAEELEPMVKAEELAPVAKAEELEPVAKAEAVELPLDPEDLETATAVEAVEPSVEGKEPDPAAAIDGLELLAKTEPVAILEDLVASVEELESAAKIADFEPLTKAEALEPLADADTSELISAEPTTVQEVEPVSPLKEASDENFEPAAEVETFVPSENAEFINSAEKLESLELPAELEQSSSNTSDLAFQQWAGGAPNVVLEPSSEAEPVYPQIDFTSQEDSAVEELPVDLSSPPISHEATAGNTLASTEFSTPAQYLDFTVDESETPQEEASASSLPLVEPVPDSPSIYAQIDFEPDEPATQSSEAMSLASLLAQRPAPDPDAELMYSWIGGESTDPFFVLHLCYFRAVRQVLQRQQIKESALGVHDYRRVLRNMGIAYNVLMDPGIRVDYDLRQLGLREPAWGHGLTIPEDAKLPEAGGKVRIAFHELLILCRIFDSEQMLAIVNASRLLSEDRFWSYLAESGLLSQVELDSIRSGYKLITNGLVSVNQFEQAFHFARAHQQQILEILLQAGWIRIEDLQQFANTPDEEELPEAPKFVETKVLPVQKGTAEFNVAASMPSWMDWGDSAELSDSSAGEGHSPFPHPADPGPSVGEDESQTSNLIDHLDYSKLADAANAQLNVTSSEYEPGDLASYQDAIQYADQLEAPLIGQAIPEEVAPPVEAKAVANQDLESEADPTNAVSKAVLSQDSELPASPVQQDYGMSDVWEPGHENAVENASSPEDPVEGIVESTEVDSVVNIQRKDSTTDPLAATNVVDDTVFSAIERPRRNEDELPERDDFASGLLVDQEEGDRSIDIADALAKTLKSNMAASLIGSGVSSSDDEINNNQDKPNNENTPSLVGQKVKMKELEFVIEPIEKSVHDLMNEIDKSIAEIESAAIQEQKADSDKSEDGDGD